MIYFSSLRGKKVFTDDNVEVGFLEDIIFLSQENSIITKLVIRTKKKEKLTIPIAYLLKINKEILIKKNYLNDSLSENELFVVKNLLDKQIIDIAGNKIVRVNDVIIQKENHYWYIAGVDIGFFGILRWLKLENIIYRWLNFLNLKPTSKFLPWSEIQPLELNRGQVKLKKEEKKLVNLRPEDLADHLEKTTLANVQKILKLLDEKKAASVISNLNINYQIALFRYFRPEKAAKILSLIDPDEAVDALLFLSKKKREEVMSFFDEKKKKELNYLLRFNNKGIGGLVTSEFLTVFSTATVKEVIERIKKETVDFYFLPYVYVVNQNKQLVGVFSLHELLLQDLETQVYKFMIQNIIVIHLTTPEEIVLKKMIKYKLSALPVTNDKKQILGIVTFDDFSEKFL